MNQTLSYIRRASKARDNGNGFLYLHMWAHGWQHLIFATNEAARKWAGSAAKYTGPRAKHA